ncbi:MAG TPA: hypothetical protein PLU79_09720 [Burkholderiaceae bacterium]|nr:hypothetical protein [Burkholderiaceae bacterium]
MATDWINRVIVRISELDDRASPDGWPEAMVVTADELRVILESEIGDITERLVNVAFAAWTAAEDSEEMEGESGREHCVASHDFDALCDALDALDELPDDRPGYTMQGCGPAKAKWALFGGGEEVGVTASESYGVLVNALGREG